ncbi:hypothetical protein CDJ04_22570 [Salmonella enterica]|uniref:Uncharacterized protein n=1 Tax=Salmonella enterica I TaxID=59201 RepID=A0A403QQ77_SALET|nr:hypothetical protein [Salmonella enterica]EAS0615925.1 hypothetical protein [Salmonella enterica subsp. enterica serovar Dahomey]EBV8414165.1 hypothetical protein [Salmonella enterica subsp. enterica serovar Oranienburg]ECS5199225.1 hypothetical protein [Salmonella enterica subsp. enterica serovar Poano]ECU7994155.1 hypothetical protein [Salmonella enterica subsp. enterica serovar Toucra]EDT7529692.1 hypothetical protein [Salmonella enterica subsp. enterica serovar Adelaide]MLK28309.1 hypo
MITPETASQALASWLAYPQITQETATLLITRAFLAQPARPEIAVHRIERDDGTVDYDAWRRNRINIFQRWRKLETDEHREKFAALIPAIMEVLPPLLLLRMEFADSAEYRAVVHAREQLNRAFDDLLRAVLSGGGDRRADRARDGPGRNVRWWLFPIISLTTRLTT